jgi:hypothetical protein
LKASQIYAIQKDPLIALTPVAGANRIADIADRTSKLAGALEILPLELLTTTE